MHQLAHQQAVEIFQLLVTVGATPGEDFSFDAEMGVCGLSDRAHQLLQQAYPDIDWSDVLTPLPMDSDAQAIALLHEHLGIDFVPRILETVRHRLYQLPLRQAAGYLRQVLGGVEQRTHISLYLQLQPLLDDASQVRLDYLLFQESDPEPCDYWLTDLIVAAGGSEADVQFDGSGVLISESGLRRLAEVWLGDYDLYAALAQ